MNGTYDSTVFPRIDTQCQTALCYLHKLTGIRYAVVYLASDVYELSPIHGEQKHASQEQLANVEVWQKLA
ncbi:hypothetical protein [Pseudomonas sp. OTU5201]|uniref:hypothetical protein n=1 Tax=Pseudomonas sp. OTU5201 TaxID=3043850 RepID=UPI00313C23EA